MIKLSEFEVLMKLLQNSNKTQREIAEDLNISLGKVNSVIAELKDKGLIDKNNKITKNGIDSLEPYKVNNAVILAAGMSTRFAPLSYEKPKGLLNVKGEVLIERQIKQLHSVGIKDITLVVGYMKEKMFYLEEKYGVEIVVNEDYYRYNNTSSMILVADKLSNTYICSSDNYFEKNPFEKYVYKGYYSSVYEEGETDEYCITVDKKDRIIDAKIGGSDTWVMLGHVYFDREFSNKFSSILREEFKKQAVKESLWEDLYIKFMSELDLRIRRYSKDIIREFDSLEDAYEEIEFGEGLFFIQNRLGIVSGEEVSIMASKIYTTLLEFKEDLFEGLEFVNIRTLGDVKELNVVCSDQVGGRFAKKNDFYEFCKTEFGNRYHINFLGSVSKSIDYLVWAGADGSPARYTNKVKTVEKWNDKGERQIPIVTAEELISILEE